MTVSLFSPIGGRHHHLVPRCHDPTGQCHCSLGSPHDRLWDNHHWKLLTRTNMLVHYQPGCKHSSATELSHPPQKGLELFSCQNWTYSRKLDTMSNNGELKSPLKGNGVTVILKVRQSYLPGAFDLYLNYIFTPLLNRSTHIYGLPFHNSHWPHTTPNTPPSQKHCDPFIPLSFHLGSFFCCAPLKKKTNVY